MTGQGINGIRQALKSSEQLIAIEVSNLTRSQVPGAQEIRGTLTGNDVINLGNGRQAAGPGVSIGATTADFSQGALERTGFTTDMALNGPGFFVLMDATKQLYYTRRGDFHFDTDGHLVNKDGLYVASFDFKTGELERTSLKVNPVTDALGEQILAALEDQGELQNVDLASVLGEPVANIDASLAQLKVAGYVNEINRSGNTYFTSNLGEVGDQVSFTRDGFVVNGTRGLKRGNQLALAVFPNPQGLIPGKFGGEIYKATDAAVAGGIPDFGAPGDVSMGLGDLETQALEMSTSSTTNSMGLLGMLQRNFTSTAAAVKAFLSAWDDLNSVFAR